MSIATGASRNPVRYITRYHSASAGPQCAILVQTLQVFNLDVTGVSKTPKGVEGDSADSEDRLGEETRQGGPV